MKFLTLIFLTSLFFSVLAGNPPKQTKPPLKPIDNIKQEQEAMDKNKVEEFEVGPYDLIGKYINYDRLQDELEATKKESP